MFVLCLAPLQGPVRFPFMPTSSSDSEGTSQRTPRRRSTPRSTTSRPATHDLAARPPTTMLKHPRVSDDDFGSGVAEEKAAREAKPARRSRASNRREQNRRRAASDSRTEERPIRNDGLAVNRRAKPQTDDGRITGSHGSLLDRSSTRRTNIESSGTSDRRRRITDRNAVFQHGRAGFRRRRRHEAPRSRSRRVHAFR